LPFTSTKLFLVVLVVLLPGFAAGQDDDWPSLAYLKSDYKSVAIVAHVTIRGAEITGRVGGYENWKVNCEVLESFKGKFRKGDVLEYFHGAEAGLKTDYFSGEKIVFLLNSRQSGMPEFKYTVLENSSLPYTENTAKKLRTIHKSYAKSGQSKKRTI
jgi:hypothetical protein